MQLSTCVSTLHGNRPDGLCTTWFAQKPRVLDPNDTALVKPWSRILYLRQLQECAYILFPSNSTSICRHCQRTVYACLSTNYILKMVLEHITSSGQDGDKNDHVTRFVRWTKSRGQVILYYVKFCKGKSKLNIKYIFKYTRTYKCKSLLSA